MYDIAQPYGPLVETTLRVATWNVWGRYGPWEERESRIVAALREASPDLVVLTEAWETADDSQCARLSGPLGLAHHTFCGVPAQEDETALSGVGILSRWPILHHAEQAIGHQNGSPQSQVMFAEVDGPRGPAQVFGVALYAWRPEQSLARQGQVRDLAAYVAKLQNRRGPVIVAGDFNANPDSDEIRMLTGRMAAAAPGLVFYDAWEMAGQGPGATWSNTNPWAAPALWPERRIDYVFSAWPRRGGVGHPVHCALLGTTPFDGLFPSDHYGVLTDLRY